MTDTHKQWLYNHIHKLSVACRWNKEKRKNKPSGDDTHTHCEVSQLSRRASEAEPARLLMLPSWFMVIKMPGNGCNEIVWSLEGSAGRKRDRSVIMEQGPEGSADYWFLFGVLNEQNNSVVGFTTILFISLVFCSFGNYRYRVSYTVNCFVYQ